MAYRKKRNVKRKRKAGKKYRGSRGIKMGSSMKMFKVRHITTVSSIVTSGLITISVNDDPSGANEWSSLAGLFDEYRCCGAKLKYIPEANTVQSTASGGGGITGYAPLYLVWDNNSAGTPLTTVSDAISYDAFKVKDMFRPWTFYHKFQKQIPINATASISTQGYQDTQSVQGTQGIYGIGSGFNVVAQPYGTLIITYYVSFRDRK